ncbi:hypothetical protein JRO89_XS09G0197000 [Xanthoceras sorbifolium]|uniref:Malectin-like domain-containing protein n=1 Tax=Xanthoceras sorbifolium TaxID=99658 RepID=A0ABQ8HLY5_9ROSI|nr:hypothetical protein JRO89_XS09G0197000 [Xanthoceras sorbifolium]
MQMSKQFLLALLCAFGLAVSVHSQDQSGFISLDCGLPAELSNYTDVNTGLDYISDAAFIGTGISKTLSPEFNTSDLEKQLWYVRSFPENIRNCYNIKVTNGTKYLIRARFMYGNYDPKGKAPQFQLYLGENLWAVIGFVNASTVVSLEIIHVSNLDYIDICLVNVNLGTPFISALELRPLKSGTYVTKSGSLMLLSRLDMGSTTNQIVRYKDDIYDRIWTPWNPINPTQLSTASALMSSSDYHPPGSVMNTATTLRNSSAPLVIFFETVDPNSQFYFYLHFAELEELQANQSREFNIFLDGKLWYGPLSPTYLDTTTIYTTEPSGRGRNVYQIIKTENSTHGPIINAIEVYVAIEFLKPQTVTHG